jgi:hypothetical protein
MLVYFEKLKLNLSIVNKSFVTLGKPLKYEHPFVYIRNTILLAPAGKSYLAEIGKLYENEGDLSKISIKQEDYSHRS